MAAVPLRALVPVPAAVAVVAAEAAEAAEAEVPAVRVVRVGAPAGECRGRRRTRPASRCRGATARWQAC